MKKAKLITSSAVVMTMVMSSIVPIQKKKQFIVS